MRRPTVISLPFIMAATLAVVGLLILLLSSGSFANALGIILLAVAGALTVFGVLASRVSFYDSPPKRGRGAPGPGR